MEVECSYDFVVINYVGGHACGREKVVGSLQVTINRQTGPALLTAFDYCKSERDWPSVPELRQS